MIAIIIAALAIGSSNAASSITPSYKNCTGSNAIGSLTKLEFVPNPPPVGKNFSIIGYGSVSVSLTDPSYDLKIQDGAIINKDFDEDACQPFSYEFPFNDGALYYNPVPCPVAAGNVIVNITAFVAAKAPDGTVVSEITIFQNAKEKGEEVVCVQTNLKITG